MDYLLFELETLLRKAGNIGGIKPFESCKKGLVLAKSSGDKEEKEIIQKLVQLLNDMSYVSTRDLISCNGLDTRPARNRKEIVQLWASMMAKRDRVSQ